MPVQFASERPMERRRAPRMMCAQPGELVRAGGEAFAAEIGEITRDGCRLGVSAELTPNEIVTLRIDGIGEVRARMVWRSAVAYGCSFETSLPPGAITASLIDTAAIPADMAAPSGRLRAVAPVVSSVLAALTLSVGFWSLGIAALHHAIG